MTTKRIIEPTRQVAAKLTKPKNPGTLLVQRIDDDVDPRTVKATTYMMRNIYTQFGTAFVNSLDVMAFIMHCHNVGMVKNGWDVLDVCCGRAVQLPLLRWRKPRIKSYTGVDISEKNIGEARRWSARTNIAARRLAPNHEGVGEPYYPFNVNLLVHDAADMSRRLADEALGPFDHIMFVGIEHMQRWDGVQALRECAAVLKRGHRMFMSMPNTPDKKGVYDVQYKAHLYEWNKNELVDELGKAGFEVEAVYGQLAKVSTYRAKLATYYPNLLPLYDQMSAYLPNEWLMATFPVLTPDIADEVALIARLK